MAPKPDSLRSFSLEAFAFQQATLGLDHEHFGAYMRLLLAAWYMSSGEPCLPADPATLARICSAYGKWRRLSKKILPFFVERDGSLYSPVLSAEWKRRTERLSRPGAVLPPNARPGSRGSYSMFTNNPTGERRAILLVRDGNKCVWCSATESLHLDHVIPRALGGDDSDENFQVLCRRCNARKGSSERARG